MVWLPLSCINSYIIWCRPKPGSVPKGSWSKIKASAHLGKSVPSPQRKILLTLSNSYDHQQEEQSQRRAEIHFKELLASYAEETIWLQSSVNIVFGKWCQKQGWKKKKRKETPYWTDWTMFQNRPARFWVTELGLSQCKPQCALQSPAAQR